MLKTGVTANLLQNQKNQQQMFGLNNQPPQQQQQPQSFSFGQPQQQKPQVSIGGFGLQQQQQPQAAGTLGGFGQQQQQQQVVQVSKYSKYVDLPQDVQQKLDQLHKKIQGDKHAAMKLSTLATQQQLQHVRHKYLEHANLPQKLRSIADKIRNDVQMAKMMLRHDLQQLATDAEVAMRICDRPTQMMRNDVAAPVGTQDDPVLQNFVRFSEQSTQTIEQLRLRVDELDMHVSQLMQQLDSPSADKENPDQLYNALKNDLEAMVVQAQRVNQLHDQIQQQVEVYQQWRKMMPSTQQLGQLQYVKQDDPVDKVMRASVISK